MFRIIKTDGTELGVTESVNYIKISERSGAFIQTERENAIGVAFNSAPYNLLGHDEIEGADTVIVSETDGGKQFSEQQSALDEIILQILEG